VRELIFYFNLHVLLGSNIRYWNIVKEVVISSGVRRKDISYDKERKRVSGSLINSI